MTPEQPRSVDLYSQLMQLWWDGYVGMTRYTMRAATSLYDLMFRAYPGTVNQALEAAYRENVERANQLRDIAVNQTRAAEETAESVKDEFVAKTGELQEAAARPAPRDRQRAER